jgi:hypothetical protein
MGPVGTMGLMCFVLVVGSERVIKFEVVTDVGLLIRKRRMSCRFEHEDDNWDSTKALFKKR